MDLVMSYREAEDKGETWKNIVKKRMEAIAKEHLREGSPSPHNQDGPEVQLLLRGAAEEKPYTYTGRTSKQHNRPT